MPKEKRKKRKAARIIKKLGNKPINKAAKMARKKLKKKKY